MKIFSYFLLDLTFIFITPYIGNPGLIGECKTQAEQS